MNTNIRDMVVLIVDPVHNEYGQLGQITWHDWRESGDMGIRFSDEDEIVLPDGNLEGDKWRPIKSFYRHDDETGRVFDSNRKAGLKGLKELYLSLNLGGLEELQEKYFELFGEYI
ncbi:hypothetical protein KY314_02795 [Candidatus Woesearchaeota archaeon]|nr:hypothetical protein [Candidatus Woesearchaeota archaeon]